MTLSEFCKYFDHTLLKAEATAEQIDAVCREALELQTATVCVNPVFVPQVASTLSGSSVLCCAVAGFPLGASVATIKAAEAETAIRNGAREVDMVIWIGGLKSGRTREVEHDVRSVADVCHACNAALKVIIECALLSDAEKRLATRICIDGGADFVKTSTGFAAGGAKPEDVRLIAEIAQPVNVGVKAAGGIRTYDDALAMIDAGATRLGASATRDIVVQARARGLI